MKHLTTARALVCAVALSACSSVVVGPSTDASVDGAPLVDASVTEVSDAGAPRCASGLTQCNASCVDTAINPFHCGACNARCGASRECSDGRCAERCDAPLTRCATACSDLTRDPSHCGSCGRVCPAGSTCEGGSCRAPPLVHYVATTDTQVEASWVDACAAAPHRNEVVNTDDNSAIVPLAFVFPFWGVTLREGAPINVCSNGWIGLDGMPNSSLSGVIPQPAAPNAVIAAQWVDLVTTASGVCVATVGSAPSRRMAFEWSDATYFGDGATRTTFEIVLDEDGTIELLYRALPGAHASTIGIEDSSGFNGLSLCGGVGATCPRTSGTRVRLVPTR